MYFERSEMEVDLHYILNAGRHINFAKAVK
jgi:hypothetical protein